MPDESERHASEERSGANSPTSRGEEERPARQSSGEPVDPPKTKAPLSAKRLSDAFARMLGKDPAEAQRPHEQGAPSSQPGHPGDAPTTETGLEPEPAEDSGEVTPRGILEAMLFVGNPDNRPLTPARAAELMRGVEPGDIRGLTEELNHEYEEDNCPYRVVGEGDGYRMVLGPEYHRLRDRFYGRVRRARLSRAAMEVLAIVAYNQPLTSESVGRIRGTASGGVLAKLVRRQLLRIERPEETPRKAHYHTTERFLKFFGLERLDDLPRSQELEKR